MIWDLYGRLNQATDRPVVKDVVYENELSNEVKAMMLYYLTAYCVDTDLYRIMLQYLQKEEIASLKGVLTYNYRKLFLMNPNQAL